MLYNSGLFQRVAHAWLAPPRFQDLGGTAGRGLGLQKQTKVPDELLWLDVRPSLQKYHAFFFFFFLALPPSSVWKALNLRLGAERRLKPRSFVLFQKGCLKALGKE